MRFATVVGLENAMSGELVYIVSQENETDMFDEEITSRNEEQSNELQNQEDNTNLSDEIKLSEEIEDSEIETGEVTEVSIGMVFNLQEDQVGILILETSTKGVKEGDIVYGTDMLPSVKFSPKTFGKIINPLGDVLDEEGNENENMKLAFISSLFETEEDESVL